MDTEPIRFPSRVAELAFDALVTRMGEISEEGWAAGWMMNNAHNLWDIVCGESRRDYGQTTLADEDVAEIRQLARDCGGWVSEAGSGWVSFADWDREHTACQIKDLEYRLNSRKNALVCDHEWRYLAFQTEYDYCYKCHTKRFAVDPAANKAASDAQDAKGRAEWEETRAASIRAAAFLRTLGHRLTEPDWDDKYDKCWRWKKPGEESASQRMLWDVIEGAAALGWKDEEPV